jgi:hypothetical protein
MAKQEPHRDAKPDDKKMGGVLRALLTVPKKKLDEALEAEKRNRPPRDRGDEA